MSQDRAKTEPRPNHVRRRKSFLRKRLSPRVRDVFADLMTDKVDVGAYLESQCLKVAELTVRAEDLRAKLDVMLAAAKGNGADAEAGVRSLAALINAVTKLEINRPPSRRRSYQDRPQAGRPRLGRDAEGGRPDHRARGSGG